MTDAGEHPDPPDPLHAHTLEECGPVAFMAQASWWQKLRHPIAWSVWRHTVEEQVIVRYGPDAPETKRLWVRGIVLHAVIIFGCYVAVSFLAAPWAWAAILVMVAGVLPNGAYRAVRAARHYRNGWLEGRQLLLAHLERAVDTNDPAGFFAMMSLESQRDVEVVLNMRTSAAPDDPSGLAEDQ